MLDRRTIRAWLRRWRLQGAPGLVPRYPTQRKRRINPEVFELIRTARFEHEWGAPRTRMCLARVHRVCLGVSTMPRAFLALGRPRLLRTKPRRRPRQLRLFENVSEATRTHETCVLASERKVPYSGRTMAIKRAGRTVKVSVSLDVEDVAVLRRRARESYGGNLSAAFSEAARLIRQREARRRLVDMLGGPTLTPAMAAAVNAEQAAHPSPARRKARRRTSAA